MKVVINTGYGGFALSQKAYERLIELGVSAGSYIEEQRDPVTGLWVRNPANDEVDIYTNGEEYKHIGEKYWSVRCSRGEFRSDPRVVQVVEELGNKVNSAYSELKVVEVPDEVDWVIEEYDGVECVAEVHRTWS